MLTHQNGKCEDYVYQKKVFKSNPIYNQDINRTKDFANF